jgi:hypothetical protein
MMCEACERGDHGNCGLQTWCECDCDGTDDCFDPDAYRDYYDVPEQPEGFSATFMPPPRPEHVEEARRLPPPEFP